MTQAFCLPVSNNRSTPVSRNAQLPQNKNSYLGIFSINKTHFNQCLFLLLLPIVAEVRLFLEEQGVSLDAFSRPPSSRSKSVILCKNLPAKTHAEELRDLFSRYDVILVKLNSLNNRILSEMVFNGRFSQARSHQ